MKKGFSLVELMIAVAIMGILAAFVVPIFQEHSTRAKESTAKENLRILRSAIDLYTAQHEGVPPGYPDGNINNTPTSVVVLAQLTQKTNILGQYDQSGPGYKYGPYFKAMPQNPFVQDDRVLVIATAPANRVGSLGWLYNPQTKQVYLNWNGTDEDGTLYLDY